MLILVKFNICPMSALPNFLCWVRHCSQLHASLLENKSFSVACVSQLGGGPQMRQRMMLLLSVITMLVQHHRYLHLVSQVAGGAGSYTNPLNRPFKSRFVAHVAQLQLPSWSYVHEKISPLDNNANSCIPQEPVDFTRLVMYHLFSNNCNIRTANIDNS